MFSVPFLNSYLCDYLFNRKSNPKAIIATGMVNRWVGKLTLMITAPGT